MWPGEVRGWEIREILGDPITWTGKSGARRWPGPRRRWWRLGPGAGDHGSLNVLQRSHRQACVWLEVPEERGRGLSREALGFGTGATGRTEVVIYSAQNEGGRGPQEAKKCVLDT